MADLHGAAALQPPAAAPPLPLAPEDDTSLDIGTRISLVEHRLVEREQRLRLQTRRLARRARAVAAPRALALKLAGGALAGGGLLWLLRRGGGHPGPAPLQPPDQAPGVPPLLLSLLPMAWPLLPLRWRHRLSPATAATVLGVALPLVQRLVQRLRARRGPR